MLCLNCRDTGHVCESHPHLVWGGLCCDWHWTNSGICPHGACGCGAGEPCPSCCAPRPADGTGSITAAFEPGRQEQVAPNRPTRTGVTIMTEPADRISDIDRLELENFPTVDPTAPLPMTNMLRYTREMDAQSVRPADVEEETRRRESGG